MHTDKTEELESTMLVWSRGYEREVVTRFLDFGVTTILRAIGLDLFFPASSSVLTELI